MQTFRKTYLEKKKANMYRHLGDGFGRVGISEEIQRAHELPQQLSQGHSTALKLLQFHLRSSINVRFRITFENFNGQVIGKTTSFKVQASGPIRATSSAHTNDCWEHTAAQPFSFDNPDNRAKQCPHQ